MSFSVNLDNGSSRALLSKQDDGVVCQRQKRKAVIIADLVVKKIYVGDDAFLAPNQSVYRYKSEAYRENLRVNFSTIFGVSSDVWGEQEKIEQAFQNIRDLLPSKCQFLKIMPKTNYEDRDKVFLSLFLYTLNGDGFPRKKGNFLSSYQAYHYAGRIFNNENFFSKLKEYTDENRLKKDINENELRDFLNGIDLETSSVDWNINL